LFNVSFGDFYVAYNEILSPKTQQKTFSKRAALSFACLNPTYSRKKRWSLRKYCSSQAPKL